MKSSWKRRSEAPQQGATSSWSASCGSLGPGPCGLEQGGVGMIRLCHLYVRTCVTVHPIMVALGQLVPRHFNDAW